MAFKLNSSNRSSSSSNNAHKKKFLANLARNGVFKTHMKRMKFVMVENTDEFCKNTSLHGLKYITSPDLYPMERVFFALSFISVVLLSGFFISKVFNKWSTTPVILSINPQPTYINKEPFPAVTICNLNQAYKKKAEKYSIFSTNYAMLQMLCKRSINVSVANTITDWSQLEQFIESVSQPCESMIVGCRYGAVNYNCSQLFRPITTDEGLCCTFNSLHPIFMYRAGSRRNKTASEVDGFEPVNWNAEWGYPKKLPENFYPRVSIGTGETLGLVLILDVESENYYCSSANSIGFKIALHSPNETPNIREIGLLLSPGRETKIRVQAEKMESEPTVREINKKYRHCLFQDESKMTFYAHYTQRNCIIECISEMLLKYCGCISYYMSKLYGNETICSIYESTCVERVRLMSLATDYVGMNCDVNCLPSCADYSFLPDFSSTPLSHSGFQISSQYVKNLSNTYVEKNIAIAKFFFAENSYRSNKQTEFIGMTDFLSSVGGLIGLFFGFSFISLAEFFYYSVIRPCHGGRKHQEIKIEVIKKTPELKIFEKKFRNIYGVNIVKAEQMPQQREQIMANISGMLDKEFAKNFANGGGVGGVAAGNVVAGVGGVVGGIGGIGSIFNTKKSLYNN